MRKYIDVHFVKLVLSKLNSTLKLHDWNKLCAREVRTEVDFTEQRLHYLISYLLKMGYIERVGKGIYRRTEKGRVFCENL